MTNPTINLVGITPQSDAHEPLFITPGELTACSIPDAETIQPSIAGGHAIVPMQELRRLASLASIDEFEFPKRTNIDWLPTTGGAIRWQYSSAQAEVVIAIAEKNCVSAVDAAAYIAHQLDPSRGFLDSKKELVSELDALPRDTSGLDLRAHHINSNFPFSVQPPAWYPRGGFANVVFHFA